MRSKENDHKIDKRKMAILKAVMSVKRFHILPFAISYIKENRDLYSIAYRAIEIYENENCTGNGKKD